MRAVYSFLLQFVATGCTVHQHTLVVFCTLPCISSSHYLIPSRYPLVSSGVRCRVETKCACARLGNRSYGVMVSLNPAIRVQIPVGPRFAIQSLMPFSLFHSRRYACSLLVLASIRCHGLYCTPAYASRLLHATLHFVLSLSHSISLSAGFEWCAMPSGDEVRVRAAG